MNRLPPHLPYPSGPYALVGDTISAAAQPLLDAQGAPIPGTVTRPSLADLRPLPDPAQRAAVAELFRSAPEVQAQRDDLAQHLSDAINYIEHSLGARAGVDDAAALRHLLDREVLTKLPLNVGTGRRAAGFDLQGAKAAVTLTQQAPSTSRMASYAQLQDITEKLATALDRLLEEREPREVIGSPQEQLVKEAFHLLDKPYAARQAHNPARGWDPAARDHLRRHRR